MVDVSLTLALDDDFLDFMVDCLNISLDLGMVFTLFLSFFSSSSIVMLRARWEV
jgi:hypothetical protein